MAFHKFEIHFSKNAILPPHLFLCELSSIYLHPGIVNQKLSTHSFHGTKSLPMCVQHEKGLVQYSAWFQKIDFFLQKLIDVKHDNNFQHLREKSNQNMSRNSIWKSNCIEFLKISTKSRRITTKKIIFKCVENGIPKSSAPDFWSASRIFVDDYLHIKCN